MSVEFSELLEGFLARDKKQRGRTKTEIAQKIGRAPSTLVQWEKGDRRPTRREYVVRLVDVLELSDHEANQLLTAAGYAPATVFQRTLHQDAAAAEEHIQELVRRATNRHLEGPDKDLIEWVARDDLQRIVAAWTGYDQTRQDLDARKWTDVVSAAERGSDRWYRPVRQSAARYHAYLCLQKIAADQHLSEFESALKLAHDALRAAELASDLTLQCRIYCRLGDICKSGGRYASSERYYSRALRIIERWRGADPGGRDEEQNRVERRWMDHWDARIRRKKASLYLLQGRATESKVLLDQAVTIFTKLPSDYELARTYYSLGWCYSVLGQWGKAFEAHDQGRQLTERIDDRRGYPDTAQRVEGALSLANDCLHLGDFDQADIFIGQAEDELKSKISMTKGGSTTSNLPMHQYNSLFVLIKARFCRDHPVSPSFDLAESYFSRGVDIALSKPFKSPSRLSSIYNSWGVLDVRLGNFDKAISKFREAESWASSCEPENKYYLIGSLINQCVTLLLSGEDDYEFDGVLQKARRVCDQAKFPLDWIRLNSVIACREALRGNWRAMLIASRDAFIAAGRVDGIVTRRVLDQLVWFVLRGPRELIGEIGGVWNDLRERDQMTHSVSLELERLVNRLEEESAIERGTPEFSTLVLP